MSQHDTFLHGEGDAWFARNAAALEPDRAAGRDPVLRLLDRAGLRPASVLEVGAANGYRLAALAACTGCRATALEPSARALADGQARFPGVRFVRGLAHAMPELPDAAFDLIIVHFVLHWVDRVRLLATVAEIDRVLSNGGCLVVGDFLPDSPQKVKYHHLPDADVWTYKQDYAALWLASGLYRLVDERTFDHAHPTAPAADASARARVALLRKDLHGLYQARLVP